MTRTFTRDELTDLDLPRHPSRKDPRHGCSVLANDMVDRTRWSIEYRLVFQLVGQPKDEAWAVFYQSPATEQQDGQDMWNDADEIEATLVRRTTKTIEAWE